jgi:acyl-coenzyme A thioesterase PaaI-like protein
MESEKKGKQSGAMRGKLPSYSKSFFMGKERQDGLQLDACYEDGRASIDFFVDSRFQGYPNVVNGGITFGILDVLLWYAILIDTKKMAMTRKVEMEFFKPILCNIHYVALSETTGIEGRDIKACAWVEDASGEVYARVTAIFREGRGKGIDAETTLSHLDYSNVPTEIKEFFLAQIGGGPAGE